MKPAIKHICKVVEHKWYVLVASMRIGSSIWLALKHDLSKFSLVEIKGYSKQFYTNEKGSIEWDVAWKHHWMHNKHHWQYWGSGLKNDEYFLPMSKKHALEMIADWMAASRAYSGTWNLDKWLSGHWGKIKLHLKTREFVKQILTRMGYQVG